MTCIVRLFIRLVLFCTLLTLVSKESQAAPFQKGDTLRYPIQDRRGDRFTYPNKNAFDLQNPSNITDSVEYDPRTRRYYLVEKIGNRYFRSPSYLTYEEFQRLQSRKAEVDYFRKRADILSNLNKKNIRPKLQWHNNLVNRIFGSGPDGLPKVEIRPQGNIDVLVGYQGQNIKNPVLPERARRTGGFDFDMNANLSVVGNIGDKLRLPINYNTLATFEFENQLKLDYTGKDDEIIKRIEAGNVAFSSKGSLIPGAQSLFGLKTQLQFGKLYITGVLANQRAQRQSQSFAGGSAMIPFEFRADDYEENRHFLLAQYFRRNYNKAVRNLPVVNSQVQILRMEVWVTNRTATTETRDVVGLMDLGESQPYNSNIQPLQPLPNGLPDNNVNNLYRTILNDQSFRNPSLVTTRLGAIQLTPVQDFEKTFARKLSTNEYSYNPLIGFISLNQPLQPDEVLGVAYQYTYNGRTYQVGEFSQDVPPDTSSRKAGIQKVLFLKLLKATSQRTQLPIWDLMMKNIYTLHTRDGSFISSIQPTDFKLNILYEEPSRGTKRYLPEGAKANVPLLTVLNLDRLNSRSDPVPDGVFDYLEGLTVVSSQARIIFPKLEPFGHDLDSAFTNPADSAALRQKYLFYPLYDTIKEVAKTYANLDRYLISGTAKGQSTSEISLGAFNVPPGSVTVTSGGQLLRENYDYTVDYNLGTVKIINQAIINSGIPVNVQYENNAGYGLQNRNFLGLRLDYHAKNTAREQLTIGGTIERLGERPFFTKTLINEDPIRNTMYGLDFNYRSEFPRLTRWLNKLPFYSSNEMSTINAYGESALLKPGHPPQIGKGSNGLIYIDDFEGTRNSIDLRFPIISWALASTPKGNGLFPEAAFIDSLPYGFNRAKLAWYNIEPVLQDKRNPNNPAKDQDLMDPRIRPVSVQQIFPSRTSEYGQAQLITFDLAYYPTEKGPYNFDVKPTSVSSGMGANGKLLAPKTRWGGIMRAIDQTDFETGNVEFIEFWMQDPFLKNPGSTGGDLYFNLGNISEDVLRDGRRFFENGVNTPKIPALMDTTTVWGQVPANPIQVTNAFSNDPDDRPFQDVGFDGLTDSGEVRKFQNYLTQLATTYGVNSPVYQKALMDPSGDNFKSYRDASFDGNSSILSRYKDINNPQGNSPVAAAGQQLVTAFTLYPDQEDLNRDNTLNELEEYFQYRVKITPADLQVGQNFITDIRDFVPNGGMREKWYLFRIPIAEYEKKIGNIPDFKSIRFIRMFLTNFADSVVLRFGKLELIRNQWRRFNFKLDTLGNYATLPANSGVEFNVLAVNKEENSFRKPIPYIEPPGVLRQQQLSNNNTVLLQNEQAMSLKICNLTRGDARGVFKTMNLDLRQYGKMEMFIHAESVNGPTDIADGELNAVIRIGNDFINNYYEIKIPLRISSWNARRDVEIWLPDNDLDLSLNDLIQLKLRRNNLPTGDPRRFGYYSEQSANGKVYSIFGNPNLGEVRAFFLGVENAKRPSACTEVWFNELRLSNLNEQGGWAALGRVDFKLADLGTLYLAGNTRSVGFGNIDQRINERAREALTQFDAATNLELGKLFPKGAGLSIPFYAGITQMTSTPQYDPYDLDIKLQDKLKVAASSTRDSVRHDAIDQTTIKTFNFTNVRKNNTSGKKQKPWSVENLDLTYSYTQQEHKNPLIENDERITHKAGLGYNYAPAPKYWEPLKRVVRTKSRWLAIVKDINFNPLPSLVGFRADVNRQFGAFRPRNVGGPKGSLQETYDKFFTFDRLYNLRWDLTRSINLDYSAVNRAWVDEDSGRLDKLERKKMWNNFWRGGRNVSFTQKATASYVLPTSKIPLLDWTTVRIGYTANFNWIAASLVAKNLGNTLQNGQDKNITGEFDFTRLYSKSRWFRALENESAANVAPPAVKDTSTVGKKKKKREPKAPLQLSATTKFFGKILTSLKSVSINYTENANTTIYGYTDSTQHIGMDFRTGAPGLPFLFGHQPDTNDINRFAQKGWLTRDSTFNYQNRQDYTQKLNIRAQLQPVRDLTIDLNLDKSFGKAYSELYKDTTGHSGFTRLNPYASGSFSISYIAFKTLFVPFHPNEVTTTFKKFQENRIILSKRLAEQNPYWQNLPTNQKVQQDGFYTGYGRYAQDVLIPAFLAAYTGKDPNTVALLKNSNPSTRSNPYSGYIPKPNWRITYNGLTRIKGFEKIFTNFSISHAYNSTLSMNSFNTDLLFRDPFLTGYPGFIDTISGNFVPYFLVPNITLTEQFAPLLDLDMQFVNQMNARVEFRKSRTLSLSLVDFQLSENRSTEFTLGAGWRKRGFPLPFRIKLPGKQDKSNKLDNDIHFQLDLSIRDDATSNSRLDQLAALPTSGQKVITISPYVDYVLSNRVNIKLYFDQRRVIPKVSSSPPITNTRAGVQIRIALQ